MLTPLEIFRRQEERDNIEAAILNLPPKGKRTKADDEKATRLVTRLKELVAKWEKDLIA